MVMKNGRQPLAKVVDNGETCLARIGAEMNELLQRHDWPEDVEKIVNNYVHKWKREWQKKGVSKAKSHSYGEFFNQDLAGFREKAKIAQLVVNRRKNRPLGKTLPPGNKG